MSCFSEWAGDRSFTVDWYGWEPGFYCVLTMSDGTVVHVDGEIVWLWDDEDASYEPLDVVLKLNAYERILWAAETKPFVTELERLCLDRLPKSVTLSDGWAAVYNHRVKWGSFTRVNARGCGYWTVGVELTNGAGGGAVGWYDGGQNEFHQVLGCCTVDEPSPCSECGTIAPETLVSEIVELSAFSDDCVGWGFSLPELVGVVNDG